MVKLHKKETRKKQKEAQRAQRMEERMVMGMEEKEQRIHVKEISTGKILRGDEAPLASELEAWLEKNPGWEEVPRDEDSGMCIILHSALKLEISAISKVQKHIFYNFKNAKKSIFCTTKKFKATKNAILNFFPVQNLISCHF